MSKKSNIVKMHEARDRYNASPDKKTSKNVPRKPVSMAKILREFRPVLPDALAIVSASMKGVPVTVRYEIKDVSRIGTEDFENWLKTAFSYESNVKVEQCEIVEYISNRKVTRTAWCVVYETLPTKQQVDQAKYVIDTVKVVESKEVEYKQKQLELMQKEKNAGVSSSNNSDDDEEEILEEVEDE